MNVHLFRANIWRHIYNLYDVIPDIVLYGKALGNGYPITACVENQLWKRQTDLL